MPYLETLDPDGLKGALEALLLVSSEPVSAIDLASTLEASPRDVAGALAELAAEYADARRGFQLREVAGGWRLFTHPDYHEQVERYVLSWDKTRLSQAALETLAVIAYHQPVSREGVRAIRGVSSDGVITSLVDKGLVREVGRDKERGQARLFGTTRAFLERFGLKNLRDLPPLEDFAADEESRQFIIDRLSTRPPMPEEPEDEGSSSPVAPSSSNESKDVAVKEDSTSPVATSSSNESKDVFIDSYGRGSRDLPTDDFDSRSQQEPESDELAENEA